MYIRIILIFFLSYHLLSAEWYEVKSVYGNTYHTLTHYFDSARVMNLQLEGELNISTDGGETWDDPFYPFTAPFTAGYIDFHKDTAYSTAGMFGDPGNNIFKFWDLGMKYIIIGFVDIGEFGLSDEKLYMYDDTYGIYHKFFQKSPENMGTAIYKTNTSGDKWEKRQSFVYKIIDRIFYVDMNTIYIVFNDKSIQVSDSNCIDWTKLDIKANNENCFQMLDRDTGFTANDYFLQYTDNKWQDKYTILDVSELNSKVAAFEFIDKNIGWVGCENGTVFHTSDNGITWERDSVQNVPFNYLVDGIQAISYDKCVIKVRNMDESEEAYYYKNYKLDNNSVNIEKNENYLAISPNPATDCIEFNIGANGHLPLQEILIFDVFGNCALNVGAIHELPLRIDISTLPPGLYFVRIGEKVEKFVVVR